MNILILNTLPIPSGQASVNRILSLAKGLVEINDKVTILSTARGNDCGFHILEGIKYCNMQENGSNVSLLVSFKKIVCYILKNKKDIDVLWLVSNSLLLIYPIWILCKLTQIKLVQEKSEFPFVLMKKGVIAKIWAWLYVNTTYKLFDGMIIMTQPLLDYFKSLVNKKCKMIKIPMTVDFTRFLNTSKKNEYGDYAAYCGNMSGNKDGVVNLLEAFSYVESEFPDFKLVMIGDTNTTQEYGYILQKTKDYKLNNVVFTGRISRDEIPKILNNAKLLCLARPSSLQSTGGFPTKLGEYLATGHPVVVTSVGEIPNYLNRENSYIVEPDNNKLFGETINEILTDYDKAVEIGRKGKEVAMQNFNYSVQTVKLHNYFMELLGNK